MKWFILLAVVFILFFGCEKDNQNSYSSSIIGEWSWFISCGGVAGCSTPQTTNITMTLMFTKDSIYYRYRNDSLESSSRFYTNKIVSVDGQDTTDIIKMASLTEKYSIYHDTLMLSAINFNAGSSWKRIK